MPANLRRIISIMRKYRSGTQEMSYNFNQETRNRGQVPLFLWIPDSGAGDVWTWVALDPDTKLVPCWFIGQRDAGCAYHFMHDLKSRLANRVQLTTDGHRAYLYAVEDAFGCEIDYAMLQKIYGSTPETPETRYSPAVCMGARKAIISGNPEHNHVSTSYVERQNLT